MKKISIILSIIIISTITSLIIFKNDKDDTKYIKYNGNKLALFVNGEKTDTLPSGNYFLVDYNCGNGSTITWDRTTSTLTFDNQYINDTCSLSFESSPKLFDLVNIGDYISYTADSSNGCSGDHCSGWNANQTATDLYKNYGCCQEPRKSFITYGWRVLHRTDNSVYIVSAGSPECITSTASNPTTTIQNLNAAALKYCHSNYLSGGICDATTAHAFNGDDFYKFTAQNYGASNARYIDNYNDGGSYGSKFCRSNYSKTYCGYHNDIINNGSNYWFASAHSETQINFMKTEDQHINFTNESLTYGLRPVLKLDSSITVTGGVGTIDSPYTISTRSGV